MNLTRLEREGAVKLTADPLLIERFKELGYNVDLRRCFYVLNVIMYRKCKKI